MWLRVTNSKYFQQKVNWDKLITTNLNFCSVCKLRSLKIYALCLKWKLCTLILHCILKPFFFSSIKIKESIAFFKCFNFLRWIYMFWNVLSTNLLFLENVCLSVRLIVPMHVKNFLWQINSRTNAEKLYIQLHLGINWCL